MTTKYARSVRAGTILLIGFTIVATVAVAAKASASAITRCHAGNVSLSLRHPVTSGGNVGLTLVLRDTQDAPCLLRGYPRLGLTLHGLPVKSTTRAVTIAVTGFAAIALFAVAAGKAGASALPPRCRTGNVTLSLRHPLASGGNSGATIVLRNTGGAPCTVRGYPVLGLRLHGQPVKSRTKDGSTYFASDPGPSVVTLEPGHAAVAHISFGTVSGTGNVRASALDVAWRRAHWFKRAGLRGAPVTVTGHKLNVTAWAPTRKG